MDKIPANLQKWLDKEPKGMIREVWQDPKTLNWIMREKPFSYTKEENSGGWDLLDNRVTK